MSKPFTDASNIPVNDAKAVITYSPVVLEVPGRPASLQMKVSAPETGSELPIILLSHGHGVSNFLSSLHGYGPLADFWAAHGFVVIQPTHLDSTTLDLRESDHPEAPLYWRTRAKDMSFILDHLDEIEAAVPGLTGRLDRDRIVVAGHSMGGHTASLLLGARLTDPHDGTEVNLADPRIKAGVLFASTGRGGDAVTEFVAEHYSFFMTTDLSEMTTRTLVVAGDKDTSPHLTVRGADWHTDPYSLSPSPKSLLTVFGAEHILGGISGYDASETTDEDPERVAALRALAWAYLWSQLYPGTPAWADAITALESGPDPIGRVESK